MISEAAGSEDIFNSFMLKTGKTSRTIGTALMAAAIMPLAENAVKHGICKTGKGGTLKIISRELPGCYEVEISDNGVGFDVNETKNDGKTHLSIALAKELKLASPEINIIFSTGYSEYALDAIEMHASGYITKPITAEKVKKEFSELRFPVKKCGSGLRIQCFGNFGVFWGISLLSSSTARRIFHLCIFQKSRKAMAVFLSVMLTVVSIMPVKVSALDAAKKEVRIPEVYPNGCLKTITVLFQADGVYGEAYGKIGIQKQATSWITFILIFPLQGHKIPLTGPIQ